MPSKTAERIFVDRLIRDLGWRVDAITASEAPDFILSLDGIRAGVEVRQVFRDNGRKGSIVARDEFERGRFLNRAAEAYYRLGGPPAHVKAILPGAWHDADEVAFAGRVLAAISGEALETIEIGTPFSVEDPETWITRLPAEAGKYMRWQCINNSVAWRGAVGWSDLEPFVESKARRLPAYRAAVDQVFLLLVADRSRNSGMIEFVDGGEVRNRHGFDAVYWHEHLIRSLRIA